MPDKLIKVKCIDKIGNRIYLQLPEFKVLEFDSEEPEYFEVGKEYEMKDEMTELKFNTDNQTN